MLNDAFPEERVRRGVELVEFEQDDDGVTARFADGETLRGALLSARTAFALPCAGKFTRMPN